MFKALLISFLLMMQQNHVSITSISYVTGTDSLKVFCQINFKDFLNDLQTIDDDRNLHTIFSKQPFPSDLINQYFNTKVFIYINKKLLIGKLLKADRIGNEIKMYLLFRVEKKPRTITVRNLILTKWHSDQTNLMIIKINDFEKGIMLTPEDNEVTFNVK
jgi:hypothetical protein